jgi:hypothetical protein
MGFFKSLFSNKALAEDIIKANEKTYWKVREERPGEDEHFYLATTLLRRFEARKKLGQDLGLLNDKENLNLVTNSETMSFSVLDPPKSIRALALYIVYKEVPSEAYRYEEECNRIMEPVMKMEENGTFMDLYRKKNPNMAKQMDELDKSE